MYNETFFPLAIPLHSNTCHSCRQVVLNVQHEKQGLQNMIQSLPGELRKIIPEIKLNSTLDWLIISKLNRRIVISGIIFLGSPGRNWIMFYSPCFPYCTFLTICLHEWQVVLNVQHGKQGLQNMIQSLPGEPRKKILWN